MAEVVFDFHEVTEFAAQLADVTFLDRVEDAWIEANSRDLAHIMRGLVPVGPGEPVHLRDELGPADEGVTAGRADWWRFLEAGTVHMPAEPFAQPSAERYAPRAAEDLGDRILRALT